MTLERSLACLACVFAVAAADRANACCGDHDTIQPEVVVWWNDLNVALSFAQGQLGNVGDCTMVGVWGPGHNTQECLENAPPKLAELAQLLEPAMPGQQIVLANIIKRAQARAGAVTLKRAKCPVRERRLERSTTLLLADAETKSDLPWRSWDNPGPEVSDDTNDEDFYAIKHRWSLRRCWASADGMLWVDMAHHAGNSCGSLNVSELFLYDAKRIDAHRKNTLGFRALQAGDLAGARVLFEQALAIDDALLLARFNLVCTLARSGAPFADGKQHLDALVGGAERVRYLQKLASDKDLDSWRAAGLDAWLTERRNVQVQAPTTARGKANKLNAEGLAHYQRKDLDKAAQAFEQAITEDPTLVVAYTNAASVRALQGNNTEALRLLQLAMIRDAKLARRKMKQDRDFDGLRQDKAFRLMVRAP